MDETLESQIADLDQLLAESEKQGKALLARVRALRKKTNAGELALLAGLFDPVPRQAEQFAVSVQTARDSLRYDAATALADGSYLAELQAEARAQGVGLTERDGRLTAFPLLLKLEAKIPAVRIGRKLERRLRPSLLVGLLRRAQAGPAERDIYASYVNEVFLSALEKHGQEIVFQFSLGAEPLPFETGSRLSQQTIAQIAEMIARHPKLPFQCFLASRHANQSLCTLARELPNFSLAGYWWHNFFPDVIRQLITERLDMLPANKQVGFFSDAYCVEWTYAKAVLVRKQMARVLAEKIDQGQYSWEDALAVARAILFESPQSLLRMAGRQA